MQNVLVKNLSSDKIINNLLVNALQFPILKNRCKKRKVNDLTL